MKIRLKGKIQEWRIKRAVDKAIQLHKENVKVYSRAIQYHSDRCCTLYVCYSDTKYSVSILCCAIRHCGDMNVVRSKTEKLMKSIVEDMQAKQLEQQKRRDASRMMSTYIMKCIHPVR